MVRIDHSGTEKFVQPHTLDKAACKAAIDTLVNGTGAGNDFTGWVNLPVDYDKEEFARIQKAAEKIKANSKALVVIGIGGSYLGARAVIELLKSPNYNALPKDTPDVYFLGNGISSDALTDVVTMLGDRDFSVNVISKSGTTTEPAIAFRIFKEMLEKKYGKEGARERIFATTDKARGALKTLATQEGYETFVVPDDVGGRYSVLSAVGLLPMAAAGIDVQTVIGEAIEAFAAMSAQSPENPAWQYAAARQHLYQLGKTTEILACYEPSFRFMAEWWKQLYGESEGKNGIGIFPASVEYNADLHSMGQYIQDGPRTLMETVVSFEQPQNEFTVPFAMGDPDRLNYLAGRKLSDISRMAQEAVKAAHIAGGVPNLEVRVPKRDEAGFAWLVCFFELACAISGYMSGVNPFDQPGVEAYKKNMFSLLGKPEAN